MGSESKRLPLGTITQSEAVSRTITESSENTRTGNKTGKEEQNKIWVKSEGLRQLAERSKINGRWIEDITPLTDSMGYFEGVCRTIQ